MFLLKAFIQLRRCHDYSLQASTDAKVLNVRFRIYHEVICFPIRKNGYVPEKTFSMGKNFQTQYFRFKIRYEQF